MCSPPCINQAISHPPFDFTVDTSLKTGRKCASISLSMQEKEHKLVEQNLPFPGRGDDPFHKKQKTQTKKEVSTRKVLALYEDYLKKRIKETWPIVRMGKRLFEEIKAQGYQGSFKTMKLFLCRVRKECEFPKETSLSYYKGYLKTSLERTQPNCISARKLFNEITARGYRGSFSAVEKFLWVIRKDTKAPKEASIQFHKEYLIKRVKEAYPKYVPGTELLEEIRAKGYQGTLKTVQSFLVPVHKSIAPKASLSFYKDYLIKRVKDALPDFVSGTELFEEIRAKGYQGSITTLQTFLSALRKKEKRPSEAYLDFHKGYITKRIKEAWPDRVPGNKLFEEIKAKGYRGSVVTLQIFMSTLRKKEKKPSEDLSNASVEFYKDYLTKRLEETYPNYVSGAQLFKEIKAKGYRKSFSTFRIFLSTLRRQEKKPSEACVEFHEEYLTKRLKETYPKFASGIQLFKEIRAKGYQGAFNTFRAFLSVLRKQEGKPSEAYTEFHRDYLIKRLEETYPSFVSGRQLFKEIRNKGYRGSLSMLQGFLSMLRKHIERPSEVYVRFHKEYLIKRIKDALPNFVPTQKLFEEITDRGYRGAFNTLQVFLSTLRKQEESLGEKSLEVHQNYSTKRLENPHPDHTKQLFEGTAEKRILSASEPYKNDLPKQLDRAPLERSNVLPEVSLHFYKDYLIKRLQETWPSCLPPEQLFEEIISRGYRGTCKEVEVFLMMISK